MPKKDPVWRFRRLIWISVGLAFSAAIAIVVTLISLRGDAIETAIREQRSLAIVLGQQVSYSTKRIETALNELGELAARMRPENPHDFRAKMHTEQVHHFLLDKLSALSHADSITIVGDDGTFLVSTRGWPTPSLNISNREHFIRLKESSGAGVYVGVPSVGLLSKETTLYFSRRLSASDGQFLGVAVVAINLQYYHSVYNAISALKGKSLLMLRRDGTVLVRYPDPQNRAGERMPAGSPWYDLVARNGGYYRSPGYFDDLVRLVAVYPLEDFPIVVNVAASEHAILALWRFRATAIAIGTIFCLLCSACLFWVAFGQFQRLFASEKSLESKGRALEETNARFHALLNHMSHGVALYGSDKKIIIANKRYGEMYGLRPEDVQPGMSLHDILKKRVTKGVFAGEPDQYMKKRLSDVDSLVSDQSIERLSDGRAVIISREPTLGGGWLTVHEDITARQQAADRIKYLAQYDQLTGVANRSLLMERMALCFERAHKDNTKFAILLLDLDDFKGVNDAYGHPVGDGLLRSVAERIRSTIGVMDVVARIGGDEFAILQTHLDEETEHPIVLANRILEIVREPYEVEGNVIFAYPSIGVAVAPVNGNDAETLLKNADFALYRAKENGRNGIRFFDPDMDSELRVQRALNAELADVISQKQLELYYQPMLHATTRQTVGMEALVRWRHPTRGLIEPDRFIRLAEKTGLINPLGEFVLRTACMDAVKWPPHIKVAINLSPAQFQGSNLVALVVDALDKTGLSPERLVLEVTESVLMEDVDSKLGVLQSLKSIGVEIALDDFGTGFSSLSYLQTFPLDIIKIDRSFVSAMQTRPHTSEIVALIVALANRLGIATVAEGIETKDQLDLVRAAGCNFVQGYLFGRPRKISEFDFDAVKHGGQSEQAA